MLPQQLQHSLRHRSLSVASSLALRASVGPLLRQASLHPHARDFWAWRRPRDYDSRSDPMFYRFCRYRTLKTRAKLLDKLRRRGRWDWDVNQRPFFSPRQIRLASHVGRPRWRDGEEQRKRKDDNENLDDEELELSKREKQWKDQMEVMRKRIEQDPYEAVFGKRFEPFWSPLVPNWMREEMGLDRWPKKAKEAASASHQTPVTASKHVPALTQNVSDLGAKSGQSVPRMQAKKRETESETESSPNGQLTSYSYTSKKSMADADPDSPNGQLTNYSYSSSTSWDSWTQKASREEWDSISGQTRRYEYDPISNRMVQVAVEESSNEAPRYGDAVSASQQNLDVPRTKVATGLSSDSRGQHIVNQKPESNGYSQQRKSREPQIKSQHSSNANSDDFAGETGKVVMSTKSSPPLATIPAVLEQKTSVYFPSLLNTSVISKIVKPAAVAKVSEGELDSLTAQDVRASVGKAKQGRDVTDRVRSNGSQARAYRNGKADPSKSEWDQAETQVMLDREMSALMQKKQAILNHENSLFHIGKQKDELRKLDERIDDVAKRPDSVSLETKHPLTELQQTRSQLMSKYGLQPKLETVLDRKLKAEVEAKPERVVPTASMASSGCTAEPSELLEPDDSAAHESTGDPVNYKARNVPKEWARQADLLQNDRVQRTLKSQGHATAKSSESLSRDLSSAKYRWIDVMNSRRAAYDAEQARKKAQKQAQDAEKNAKLERSNAMLQAEIEEQKRLMQSHENRYAHKIQSLKQELESAYKQSSNNSEMHVDRIRNLERELEKAQRSAGVVALFPKFQSERDRFQKKIGEMRTELETAYKQSSANADMQLERIQYLEKELKRAHGGNSLASTQERERYMKKIKFLREELDIAFKQSAVQGEKHVERIRDLEQEIGRLRTQITSQSSAGAETERAEGDISADAAKYAKDNSKWYKQPMHTPEATGKPSAEEIEKAARKTHDKALVQEVRDIYERRYGTITVNHRQQQRQPEQAQDEVSRGTKTGADVGGAQVELDSHEARIAAYQRRLDDVLSALKASQVGRSKSNGADSKAQSSLEDHGLIATNPIDGTTRLVESNTGNFASPTGFVGDYWDSLKGQQPGSVRNGPAGAESATAVGTAETDSGTPFRVKREERVFSGGRLKQKRQRSRHHHEHTHTQVREWKRKWRSYRSRMRWALGVGLGASGVAYAIGAAAERKEMKEKERWEQILEGRRARWE